MFKGFRRKKRKFPVQYDETGRSARSRCFELFADKTPLDKIAKDVGVKIETVRRYHLQWKEDPDFEGRYTYFKKLLKKTGPDRERTIELCARACGVPKEQFEIFLSQPHGLLKLMKGKLRLPGHAGADRKLYVVLEVAMAISDHLDNNGGQLEDVLFAFRRWMKENKEFREEEDADIKDENKTTTFTHRILAAAAEQERRGRVQLDRLSVEERDAILRYGMDSYRKKIETFYWLSIAALMAGGLTQEQAREKLYQDLLDKGDLEGAKKMREYQDIVHPLKTGDQLPPPSPPEPPPIT